MRKQLIICFCLWHMFAVAAYLLPNNQGGETGRQMKYLHELSRPYILQLSQWQKWDIFSPNPLRRVSEYRIEEMGVQNWETVKALKYETMAFYERAKEFKVLGRIEEDWGMLGEPYLLSLCQRLGSNGKALRLIARSTVLPDALLQLSQLAETRLQATEKVLATTTCPA